MEIKYVNNYVVIRFKRLNNWLSKTWCAQNDCKYEQLRWRLLKTILETFKAPLALLLPTAKRKVIRGWEHYCGAWPRYWDVTLVYRRYDGVLGGTLELLSVHGGNCWHSVFMPRRRIVYTDGCMDIEDFLKHELRIL